MVEVDGVPDDWALNAARLLFDCIALVAAATAATATLATTKGTIMKTMSTATITRSLID